MTIQSLIHHHPPSQNMPVAARAACLRAIPKHHAKPIRLCKWNHFRRDRNQRLRTHCLDTKRSWLDHQSLWQTLITTRHMTSLKRCWWNGTEGSQVQFSSPMRMRSFWCSPYRLDNRSRQLGFSSLIQSTASKTTKERSYKSLGLLLWVGKDSCRLLRDIKAITFNRFKRCKLLHKATSRSTAWQ